MSYHELKEKQRGFRKTNAHRHENREREQKNRKTKKKNREKEINLIKGE